MPPAAARAIVCLTLSASMLAPLLATPAIAQAPDDDTFVSDAGRFFSGDALRDAADLIDSIRSLHDRDVRVETYAEVPAHLKGDLARDGLEKFYDDWLNRRARQLGFRGVFILITRTPGRVQVGVDKSIQRRAFTADDRDALRDALVAAFRDARYDEGLLDGLRFVRRKLDENAARERSPTVPVARAGTCWLTNNEQ